MYFRKIVGFFSTIISSFLNFIFPPQCVVCDKVYKKTRFGEEIYICKDCMKKIYFTDNFSSTCKKCSRPIDDGLICIGCQIVRHDFDVAFSCTLYKTEMRKSLLSYKFSDQHHKYRTYARILADKINTISPFPDFDVVVSVPLSKKRLKKRGFDHLLPIARHISKETKKPYIKNSIIKIKDTPPQSTLTFEERRASVKGAFKVNDKIDFHDKSVLLIDDIYTTGSTVDEISKILKKKGAKHVTVLTLCITPSIER